MPGRRKRTRLEHICQQYAARLRLFRGDGDGKISCNTASGDDGGLRPDVGDSHGNPRLLAQHRYATVRDCRAWRRALVSSPAASFTITVAPTLSTHHEAAIGQAFLW